MKDRNLGTVQPECGIGVGALPPRKARAAGEREGESGDWAGFDQGLFNLTSKLAAEIAGRNYLFFLCDVDASGMDGLRAACRAGGPQDVVPTYTAFVVKAAARALGLHPRLNAMIQRRPWSTRLVRFNTVTATVAVERSAGGTELVLAAVSESPDRASLEDLTRQLRHFATASPAAIPELARFVSLAKWASCFPRAVGLLLAVPNLSPALWRRFRGGSFVVTSPAKYGGCDTLLPAWPWPLTISFGTVKERPWVEAGRLVVRRTMRLTLAADRCLAHGAALARFAETLRGLLEQPQELAQRGSYSP